jgi:CDP-diacylglycerol--glycerol-3-phosphate 3-phosphatidyltransferase
VRLQVQETASLHWLVDLTSWLSVWRETLGVVIFLTAAATDWLDGFLARRRGEVTTLGKLLDPIADKLLTGSAFIALVELGLAPAWMVVVIVGREFAVSGMRNIAASRGVVMAASKWGKVKTVAQVVAITLLILTNTLERWVQYGNLGKGALWIVMLLAVYSMIEYCRSFVKTVDLGAE